MSADVIRDLIENALAGYIGDPITPTLVEEMHLSAAAAMPSETTVGYLRPFFKDMPSFWSDDHPAYVAPAEEFESTHADFLFGEDDAAVNIRLCVKLSD